MHPPPPVEPPIPPPVVDSPPPPLPSPPPPPSAPPPAPPPAEPPIPNSPLPPLLLPLLFPPHLLPVLLAPLFPPLPPPMTQPPPPPPSLSPSLPPSAAPPSPSTPSPPSGSGGFSPPFSQGGNAPPSPSPQSPPPPASGEGGGVSMGVVVGIAVGAGVVILGVAGVLLVVNEMATKHHPNLVRLLGYCIDVDVAAERTEQIVIYEFMENGDLEQWIGPGGVFDVLIGVAQGLQYLHSFHIVHRDIKPANILLDKKMQAKVADFGLVRLGEGTTVIATRVMGTPGYVDPAYFKSQKATPMADVHSFGVVMLTMITARKALECLDEGQINLKQWVQPLVAENNAQAIKDPRLDAPNDLILKLTRFALSCTATPVATRPSMARILSDLIAMKEEFLGPDPDPLVVRIDSDLENRRGPSFSREIRRAEEVASWGGGASESSGAMVSSGVVESGAMGSSTSFDV
ncbi:unnamed protein product [Closterium sp. NIES-64]|nr:unnamed protein product [Closterium sp. NIES-64]